ncbi:oxidoreductase protein [Rhizobium rhizogenes K84]|nr:oxidoreductase protein [Rhizobium rhizogenes K84]
MRLSFGFVRGDHIACLYHGWQYDTAGQCRYIPAHPSLEVPQTIKVPTYLAEERYGTIWATTAREALLPEIDAAMGVTPVRSLYVERGADDILAALEKAGVGNFAGNAGTVELGDDRLLVAVQVVSPEKTAVHIVILGSPAVNAGAKQKHYAQWAEGLRFDLEHIAEVA